MTIFPDGLYVKFYCIWDKAENVKNNNRKTKTTVLLYRPRSTINADLYILARFVDA